MQKVALVFKLLETEFTLQGRPQYSVEIEYGTGWAAKVSRCHGRYGVQCGHSNTSRILRQAGPLIEARRGCAR